MASRPRVDHADDAFHERLQERLYRHALDLLGAGHDVILEDGLWTARERAQKHADATARGARTELHLFDLSVDDLWRRLEDRNASAPRGAVPITRSQLDGWWRIFERPDDAELRRFDAVVIHRAGGD